ncbi:MAG: hypothetical protein F9B45_32300 [Phycisphaera sp. RhM]|nr:hypothetical protein [Phycisphaera sp. RhM]
MHPFYLIRNAARRNKVLSNLSPAVRVSPECTSWSADGVFIHLAIEPVAQSDRLPPRLRRVD